MIIFHMIIFRSEFLPKWWSSSSTMLTLPNMFFLVLQQEKRWFSEPLSGHNDQTTDNSKTNIPLHFFRFVRKVCFQCSASAFVPSDPRKSLLVNISSEAKMFLKVCQR
jgi:hypothetical protein